MPEIERPALVPVPPLACLFLHGADALEWLQGQVSQDLARLEVEETREACFCSATGQIESVAVIKRLPDRIGIVSPAGTENVLVNRVANSVFMEDVSLELAPADWQPHLVLGSNIAPIEAAFYHSYRFAGEGTMYWGADVPNLPLLCSELAEALRIESGIPVWGKDITTRTLPPELGKAFTDRTVSYSKGCYVGQEVLMRIHSRGHTNKSWVGLICEQPVEVGAAVSSTNRENSGFITSAAVSKTIGPIAAAMLHNDSSGFGQQVVVGQVRAEVRPFPLRA